MDPLELLKVAGAGVAVLAAVWLVFKAAINTHAKNAYDSLKLRHTEELENKQRRITTLEEKFAELEGKLKAAESDRETSRAELSNLRHEFDAFKNAATASSEQLHARVARLEWGAHATRTLVELQTLPSLVIAEEPLEARPEDLDPWVLIHDLCQLARLYGSYASWLVLDGRDPELVYGERLANHTHEECRVNYADVRSRVEMDLQVIRSLFGKALSELSAKPPSPPS